MGVKEIPTKEFIAFLKFKGIEIERTKGSHSCVNYPKGHPSRLTRPIVVRLADKMIPQLHVHTNLQNLGISKDDFNQWQRSSQKGFKKKVANKAQESTYVDPSQIQDSGLQPLDPPQEPIVQ